MNLKFNNELLKDLNFGDVYLLAMSELYDNISEAIQKSTEDFSKILKKCEKPARRLRENCEKGFSQSAEEHPKPSIKSRVFEKSQR